MRICILAKLVSEETASLAETDDEAAWNSKPQKQKPGLILWKMPARLRREQIKIRLSR